MSNTSRTEGCKISIEMLKNWGQYAAEVTELNGCINDLQKEISFSSLPNAVGYHKAGRPTGIVKPVEKASADIAKYEDEISNIKRQISVLEKNKEIVDRFIETLDPTERRLVTLRYRNKKRWQAIALKVYLSIRQCYRYHNKILNELKDFANSQA